LNRSSIKFRSRHAVTKAHDIAQPNNCDCQIIEENKSVVFIGWRC